MEQGIDRADRVDRHGGRSRDKRSFAGKRARGLKRAVTGLSSGPRGAAPRLLPAGKHAEDVLIDLLGRGHGLPDRGVHVFGIIGVVRVQGVRVGQQRDLLLGLDLGEHVVGAYGFDPDAALFIARQRVEIAAVVGIADQRARVLLQDAQDIFPEVRRRNHGIGGHPGQKLHGHRHTAHEHGTADIAGRTVIFPHRHDRAKG